MPEMKTLNGYEIVDAKAREALDGKLDLSGGTMTGELTIGQGNGNGIQLGTAGVINATYGYNSNYTVFGMLNQELKIGSNLIPALIRSSKKLQCKIGQNANQYIATEDYVDNIKVWKHELDISEEDWQNEDGDYIITTSVTLIILTSGDVELNKDNLKTYIDKGLVAVKNPYYNDPNAPFTLLNLSDNSLWWSGTNTLYFNCYGINNVNDTFTELSCSININNAIITDSKTQL